MSDKATKTKKATKAHGGRRGWTPSTLYKYLNEYMKSVGMDDTVPVSEVKNSLRDDIVEASQK